MADGQEFNREDIPDVMEDQEPEEEEDGEDLFGAACSKLVRSLN